MVHACMCVRECPSTVQGRAPPLASLGAARLRQRGRASYRQRCVNPAHLRAACASHFVAVAPSCELHRSEPDFELMMTGGGWGQGAQLPNQEGGPERVGGSMLQLRYNAGSAVPLLDLPAWLSLRGSFTPALPLTNF